MARKVQTDNYTIEEHALWMAAHVDDSKTPAERLVNLWRGVLAHGILEATPRSSTFQTSAEAQNAALRWLKAGNEDFELTCAFAGYEPDAVLKSVADDVARARTELQAKYRVGTHANPQRVAERRQAEQRDVETKPTRKKQRVHEFRGKLRTRKEIADLLGVNHKTFYTYAQNRKSVAAAIAYYTGQKNK